MEMLVTKFSKGKYNNERALFDERISPENVKLMGEMIALQALHTVKRFDFKVADKLYIGLINDLHHMNETNYTVSDGYDLAQTAICFLCEFMGRNANEIYGLDKKGKAVTIKMECYRVVDRELTHIRSVASKSDSIDFTDYKALPADPVDCFDREEFDYTRADKIVAAMKLTAIEMAVLNCYMSSMRQAEVMTELSIGRGALNNRKAAIKRKYLQAVGV